MLVQDNLNARTDAVFYQHLPAAEAGVPAARFRGAFPRGVTEGRYPPKTASWLNTVGLKPSAIALQCLPQRIPTLPELTAHVTACVTQRNAARAIVHWHFTLEKARTKLGRHYQKIRVTNSPG